MNSMLILTRANYDHAAMSARHDDMTPAALIPIGGFLGSGKTTLASAARSVAICTGRLGVITNDQAPGLVDTALLVSEGLGIGEVAGNCFCCDFHGLARECTRLRDGGANVILAEAVGSCTDLVATVLRPMRERFGEGWRVAPLTVVVDPRHVQRVLLNPRRRRLHGSAAYIYEKQLEEAEVILLNKVDLLAPTERDVYRRRLEETSPRARVLCVSALRGEGVNEWLEVVLTREHDSTRTTIELDYDTYAEGEAVLAWLNATVALGSDNATAWSAWLNEFLDALGE